MISSRDFNLLRSAMPTPAGDTGRRGLPPCPYRILLGASSSSASRSTAHHDGPCPEDAWRGVSPAPTAGAGRPEAKAEPGGPRRGRRDEGHRWASPSGLPSRRRGRATLGALVLDPDRA